MASGDNYQPLRAVHRNLAPRGGQNLSLLSPDCRCLLCATGAHPIRGPVVSRQTGLMQFETKGTIGLVNVGGLHQFSLCKLSESLMYARPDNNFQSVVIADEDDFPPLPLID